ncbi:S8 family serine peptidase, partial [Planctomycetota bacterium]
SQKTHSRQSVLFCWAASLRLCCFDETDPMTTTLSGARFFRARSERLEDRILLAGDFCAGESVNSHNVAAFFASADPSVDGKRTVQQTPELLALSVSHADAMANVRERFQLDGLGQTVAVIDSGIAFDHDALGGGYGPDFRVVGGWDFTEPHDRSPYDDAPVGLHGTHVAGIIGSSDDQYPGIARRI